MRRFLLLCSLGFPLVMFLGLEGCREESTVAQAVPQKLEVYIPDPSSVGFDLAPWPGGGEGQWLATYTAQGKTARFVIDLGPSKSSDSGGIRIGFGDGRFLAQPGSDASVLLLDLKKALEANKLPKKVVRASSLPFTYASLGDHQSQVSDGGFVSKPPGNWIVMKVFLGNNDEGEVFLNLNPAIGKGQFSIKDADYGDYVVAKLATVL